MTYSVPLLIVLALVTLWTKAPLWVPTIFLVLALVASGALHF